MRFRTLHPAWLMALGFFLTASVVDAQVFRWDNGQLIPGTEDVTIGPDVQLDGLDLAWADLPGANQPTIGRRTSRASSLRGTTCPDGIFRGTIFPAAAWPPTFGKRICPTPI